MMMARKMVTTNLEFGELKGMVWIRNADVGRSRREVDMELEPWVEVVGAEGRSGVG